MKISAKDKRSSLLWYNVNGEEIFLNCHQVRQVHRHLLQQGRHHRRGKDPAISPGEIQDRSPGIKTKQKLFCRHRC